MDDSVVIIVVLIGLAVMYLIAQIPISIAKSRKHPSEAAIAACSLLSIVFFPLWFVALIWALAGEDRNAIPAIPIRRAQPLNMPTNYDGPGRFKVDGVDKATAMDTTTYIQASSAANAKVKAELQGIVVTAVTREA